MDYLDISLVHLTNDPNLFKTTHETMRLFLNILYFRYIRNVVAKFYSEKSDTKELKIRISRPFLLNDRNMFFTEQGFVEQIKQDDVYRAIYDFWHRLIYILQKQFQRQSPSPR